MSLKIAIVGAGFSGLAVALQLRDKSSDLDITLYDGGNNMAKGIAYSTQNPSHLLNVTAGNMSVFSDNPTHFVTWLRNRHQHYKSHANIAEEFVPRCWYGAYLTELANELLTMTENPVVLQPSHVIALEKKQQQYLLTLANNEQFAADYVVLAFGLSLPTRIKAAQHHQSVIQNPWDFSLLKNIANKADVCIIGTGLTMIDTVLALEDQHHQGKIYAISRHGLLPQAHQPFNKDYVLDHRALPKKLTPLVHYVRNAIGRVTKNGDNWRTIVDALRPYTPKIWFSFSTEDKKKFLRHLVAYWDTHRHRIAEPVFNRIQQLRTKEQLKIIAGRIISSSKNDITVCTRDDRKYLISSEWLINCSGPNTNYQNSDDVLLNSLHAAGLIQNDQLGLGIRVDNKCSVINKYNESEHQLMALGNMCKGTFWESTAVPEIRKQAKMIAHTILTT